MKRFTFLMGLLLAGALSLAVNIGVPAAYGAAGTKLKQGLEIWAESWTGNDALIIRDTSGTAKVTVSSAGATTFGGGVTFSGSLTSGNLSVEDITMENSETIVNSTDDMIEFDGAGGTDDTDLRFDLDGTHPVIDSPTDSLIEFGDPIKGSTAEFTGAITMGAAITGTDVVTATNIVDAVKTIPTSLDDWRTDADPPLEIAAGTTPNVSEEGNWDTIEWSTGETAAITTTFKVPTDYISGMELHIIHAHDDTPANTAETFACTWYNAKTGEANNPTVVDECGTPCALSAEAETLTETVIALDGGTIEADDIMRVLFGPAATDQDIHVMSLWFEYTASQ